ncbi:hypothetical protein VNO77_28790 [Canavalia gladiata]|uniref:Phytosulfokine n=1 Tax=Canavalia gladiata TaxID=3824 RepID=A0AAN9KWF8_CANGL
MKLSFHLGVILLFFFFLVSSSKLSARPLTTEQGRNRSKVNHVSGEDFVFGLEGGESFKQLLGMEDCNGENEECLQRRMSLEAHLDYIYTQHHKH